MDHMTMFKPANADLPIGPPPRKSEMVHFLTPKQFVAASFSGGRSALVSRRRVIAATLSFLPIGTERATVRQKAQ